MDQILAIMLLVGCSPDGASCAEIPVPTVAYQSVEACEADLPLQLRFTTTNDASVVGACTAVSAETMEQSASVEWSLDRAGNLSVSVVAEPELVASADTGTTSTR